MRLFREMAALAVVLPLLACAQTVSAPVEAARLRAGVQPINAPIPLAYGPHPAWASHIVLRVETDVDSETESLGPDTHAIIETEASGTEAISREGNVLHDEGTVDTASANGKRLSCDAGMLIRVDVSYTSQGAKIADNSRATCHVADPVFNMIGSGPRKGAFYVEPTNWEFPAGGVATGTVIRKAPGKDVGFDRGDIGGRILGRANWHDQPVIVAEFMGCGTATPPMLNDKLKLSPMRICPQGLILFSATSGWGVGAYQWFDGSTNGSIGDVPITLHVRLEMRQELQ